MVLVMPVAVFVLEQLVHVFMFVTLADVEPDADHHQRRRHAEAHGHRLTEQEHANERTEAQRHGQPSTPNSGKRAAAPWQRQRLRCEIRSPSDAERIGPRREVRNFGGVLALRAVGQRRVRRRSRQRRDGTLERRFAG